MLTHHLPLLPFLPFFLFLPLLPSFFALRGIFFNFVYVVYIPPLYNHRGLRSLQDNYFPCNDFRTR